MLLHATGVRREVRHGSGLGQPSLNAKWSGRPDEYDCARRCWLNHHRLDFLTSQIRASGLDPGAHVLEVASGTGWLLHQLAQRFPALQFTGVDADLSYVAFASDRASPNERYEAVSAEELTPTFRAGRFHLILSNDALHHVRSPADVFAAVRRVAGTDARWWLIEPNAFNPYTLVKQHFTQGERNFFPARALRQATEAGWSLRARHYLFLVPPTFQAAPGWMRALERRFEDNVLLAGGVFLELGRRRD